MDGLVSNSINDQRSCFVGIYRMAVGGMTRKEALIIGKVIADRWYRCYIGKIIADRWYHCYFEAIKQQQKKTNYCE